MLTEEEKVCVPPHMETRLRDNHLAAIGQVMQDQDEKTEILCSENPGPRVRAARLCLAVAAALAMSQA
jgi:hypothetical protein